MAPPPIPSASEAESLMTEPFRPVEATATIRFKHRHDPRTEAIDYTVRVNFSAAVIRANDLPPEPIVVGYRMTELARWQGGPGAGISMIEKMMRALEGVRPIAARCFAEACFFDPRLTLGDLGISRRDEGERCVDVPLHWNAELGEYTNQHLALMTGDETPWSWLSRIIYGQLDRRWMTQFDPRTRTGHDARTFSWSSSLHDHPRAIDSPVPRISSHEIMEAWSARTPEHRDALDAVQDQIRQYWAASRAEGEEVARAFGIDRATLEGGGEATTYAQTSARAHELTTFSMQALRDVMSQFGLFGTTAVEATQSAREFNRLLSRMPGLMEQRPAPRRSREPGPFERSWQDHHPDPIDSSPEAFDRRMDALGLELAALREIRDARSNLDPENPLDPEDLAEAAIFEADGIEDPLHGVPQTLGAEGGPDVRSGGRLVEAPDWAEPLAPPDPNREKYRSR